MPEKDTRFGIVFKYSSAQCYEQLCFSIFEIPWLIGARLFICKLGDIVNETTDSTCRILKFHFWMGKIECVCNLRELYTSTILSIRVKEL